MDRQGLEIKNLIDLGRLEEAEKLILNKMRSDPEHADPYYFLATVRHFQGRFSEVIGNLKRCLSIDPGHTDAAISLSVLYNDIGKYDEAKRVFEQANQSVSKKKIGDDAEVDRKFSVKHLEIADLYFRYRRYDEAIEEYGKAILLDPKSLDLRIKRAKAFSKKGFLSRAIQELQQIKAEYPDFLAARIQLGLLYYSQRDLLDAELEWEAALALDPTHREANAYLEMAKEARTKSAPISYQPQL